MHCRSLWLPWCQAYGLADPATEALGGFFLFGAANAIRHQFEWLTVFASPELSSTEHEQCKQGKGITHAIEKEHPYRPGIAVPQGARTRLPIGHSKDLVTGRNCTTRRPRIQRTSSAASKILVVTVSARDSQCRRTSNISSTSSARSTGSRYQLPLGLGTEVKVPFPWHHTNTELPMHLPVTKEPSRVYLTRPAVSAAPAAGRARVRFEFRSEAQRGSRAWGGMARSAARGGGSQGIQHRHRLRLRRRRGSRPGYSSGSLWSRPNQSSAQSELINAAQSSATPVASVPPAIDSVLPRTARRPASPRNR